MKMKINKSFIKSVTFGLAVAAVGVVTDCKKDMLMEDLLKRVSELEKK